MNQAGTPEAADRRGAARVAAARVAGDAEAAVREASLAEAGQRDPGSPTGQGVRRVRGSRRAQRPAAAGVDPSPGDHALTARAAEDKPEAWGGAPVRRATQVGENDDRLRADKPPHWG
ncbi:hypothetical protein ACFSWE_15105 [Leucobacter albus]|uniref:Uncharacterized protein n=1 Tax=Leucobacter albus TaxID=272210 RepID=A0ABW3TQ86_9MICO